MIEPKLKTEDEVLDFTQTKRELIVDALMEGGVPKDPKMISALLSTLDGMDKTALTKKKLVSDANLGDKYGVANAAITQLLTQLRDKVKTPVQIDPNAPAVNFDIPADIPPVSIRPGELGTANENLNVDQLIPEE